MSRTTTGNPTREIESSEDLCAMVRECTERKMSIVDYGVAHAGLGHPPPNEHLRLVQKGTVLEHYNRDMTVRAAAGTSMGELQAELAEHDQFVPIDADPDMTLGEVICHNVYGPMRVAYGSIRDLLLGLSYVDGAGHQIAVGGRTVKNVAGYDVSRFMVGSLGELGIVYEAIVRTYSIPDRVVVIRLQSDEPSQVDSMLTDWLLSDAAPAWLFLNMSDGSATLRLGYFGRSAACEVQVRALENLIKDRPKLSIISTATRSAPDDATDRATRRRWRREATALCKIVVPPATTGSVCQRLAEWARDRTMVNIDGLPMHGCIFIGGTIDAALAGELDRVIATIVDPLPGFRVWYQRPEGTESMSPFAPQPTDYAMLTRLKEAMDPQGLFNPGRLIRPESVTS